ncbi:bola-like protein [Neoconidiobolus thromboides FSU 785]|nr:bola-like protein [Neoconidiobolus thromboides FSU 785]
MLFNSLLKTKFINLRSLSTSSSIMNELKPLETLIKSKLEKAYNPTTLEIVNDSHKHSHHTAMRGVTSKETHFRVTIVSSEFKGKNLMQRHRMIYKTLEEEMQDGKVHALQLKTKTLEEV